VGQDAAPAGVVRSHALGRLRGSANKFTQFAQCKLLCPPGHYESAARSSLTVRRKCLPRSAARSRLSSQGRRRRSPRWSAGRRARPTTARAAPHERGVGCAARRSTSPRNSRAHRAASTNSFARNRGRRMRDAITHADNDCRRCVPGAAQREAVRCRTGTAKAAVSLAVPDQRRTAPQELRAAPRPGHPA
jgi:hypothetical protein